LWMVPIPQLVLGPIVSSLQQNSASAARFFFQIAGVPVAQDGVMLSVPGLTLEVVQECSSIRSSSMLLVTGMVLARLSLRSGWAMTLATLALLVLAVAKNGFRIFTLTMLALYVDPGFLHGQLHHNGGVVFLLLALACFVALLWFLGQLERKTPSRQSFGNTAPVVAATLAESHQYSGRN
jgi:exosortase